MDYLHMELLSPVMLDRINDALYEVHEATSIDGVISGLVTHLPGLIQVGSLAAFYVGKDGWEFTEVISPHLDPKMFDLYKDYYEQFDVYKDLIFTQDPLPPIDRSSDYMNYKEWENNPHRSDFLLPHEIYHLAGMQITVDGQLVADACFHREESAPDFNEKDLAILHLLQRHISLACRNCRLHEGSADLQNHLEASLQTDLHGVFIFNHRLRLVYRNSTAVTMSNVYREYAGKGASLYGMLAELILQQQSADAGASRKVYKPSWNGSLRFVHQLLPYTVIATASSPSSSRYIVYLEWSDYLDQQEETDFLYGLSNREHEVAELVARGMNNTTIAQTLNISPNTVKTHLKHILEKTGGRNRAEAVYILFGNHRQDSSVITDGM